MSRLAAVVAALVLTAGGGAFAAESQLVSEFRRFCIETDADSAKALALADAAGWKATTEFADSEGQGREITDANGRRVLMLTTETGNGPARGACAIGLDKGPPPASFEAELSALVGFAPTPAQDGGSNWMFVQGPEGRRDVSQAPKEERPELLRTLGVHLVAVGTQRTTTVLVHLKMGPL